MPVNMSTAIFEGCNVVSGLQIMAGEEEDAQRRTFQEDLTRANITWEEAEHNTLRWIVLCGVLAAGRTKAGYRLTGFRYLQSVPAAGKKV